jgi:hypothetical protein
MALETVPLVPNKLASHRLAEVKLGLNGRPGSAIAGSLAEN